MDLGPLNKMAATRHGNASAKLWSGAREQFSSRLMLGTCTDEENAESLEMHDWAQPALWGKRTLALKDKHDGVHTRPPSEEAQHLRQGAYDVRLTSETEGEPVNGVLELTLAALQPDDTPQGPERSRTVTTGRALSATDLEAITTIRVIGARNVMTTGR